MMCSFQVEAQLRATSEGLSRRRYLGAYPNNGGLTKSLCNSNISSDLYG